MTPAALVTIRTGLGLTRQQLSEIMGYKPEHIRHMENGRARITERFVKQLDVIIEKQNVQKKHLTP